MALRISAGLLMYRFGRCGLEVFLAHPGGPQWETKDDGHWTIPKGEAPPDEPLLETAIREFEEETGIRPHGPFTELGSIRQKGGKMVHAWAFMGDWNDGQPVRSNTYEMEWPPRSGKVQNFPEIDDARFFSIADARRKLKDTQWPLVQRLVRILEAIQAGG